MTLNLNPLIAAGVVASTAATDAVYVMFNAAVTARRPSRAASWSALWYLLSAFAVISYTGNSIYVVFAATGSWIGAYFQCDGARSWSALWYLLSASRDSYTATIYVICRDRPWIGATSVRWLDRSDSKLTPGGPAAIGNPPV